MATTRFGIYGGIDQPFPELVTPPSSPVTRMGIAGGITRYARNFTGKQPQSGATIALATETDTAFPVVDASVVAQAVQISVESDSARPVTFSQAAVITTVSSSRGTGIATANGVLTVNVDNSANITSITVNGVALTGVSIINPTEVVGNCPLSFNIAYGSTVDVIVDNGTPSPAFQVTAEVPLGMVETAFTVDYASLDPDSPFAGDPAFSAIVTGDSCVYSLFTSPSANGVSMNGLGEFTLSGTITVFQQFDYYIFDASDLTASTIIEQIFVQPGPVEVQIGQASETDTAFAVTPFVVVTQQIGLATETDTSLPVFDGSVPQQTIGQAIETDTAQPVSVGSLVQTISIAQATEINTAFSVVDGSSPTRVIGIAQETDIALPIVDVSAVIASIGLAQEIDTAFSVNYPATLDDLRDRIDTLQETVNAQTTLLNELYIRFDLDASVINTYADDGSSITNSQFTLTKTDNGNGTFDIARS